MVILKLWEVDIHESLQLHVIHGMIFLVYKVKYR